MIKKYKEPKLILKKNNW